MFLFLILQFWSVIGGEYRISFGSCYNFNDSGTPIFRRIIEKEPQLFIWLGDAAYLTVKNLNGEQIGEWNETVMEMRFNLTKHHEDYGRLREQVRIEGIWDDHDYNQNDGNKLNPYKEQVRQKYLDFLDVDWSDKRRSNIDGIYYSFKLEGSMRVKVVMLDVRWNRDGRNWTDANEMLGEKQWEWLESEMREGGSDLIIIGSGSQVMADDRLFIDGWYEQGRQRLYRLIE